MSNDIADVQEAWRIESESDYKYNLIIKDLMNTFVTDSLQYKITCTSNNGGYSMNEFESMPKSEIAKDTILAYSVSISSGVKQVYKLELRYIDSDEQNSDMGKKFSGKLFITEGTEAPSLYDKILSDNPLGQECQKTPLGIIRKVK